MAFFFFFLSLPLHPADHKKRFACSVRSLHPKEPVKRYRRRRRRRRRVLPQGTASSPTSCRESLAGAIQPVRTKYPEAYCLHPTDAIPISPANVDPLSQMFPDLEIASKMAGSLCRPPKRFKERLRVNISVLSWKAKKAFHQE